MNFPSENLLKSVNDLMSQPLSNSKGNIVYKSDLDNEMSGGKKSKKSKGTSSKKKSTSSKKTEKRPKEIDIFKKPQLEKLAKKHEVNLKTREGKPKTKKQLFNSLKRKGLV
jgi:hypothetical protein